MHPEEDLSLVSHLSYGSFFFLFLIHISLQEELRARCHRYQKPTAPTSMPQVSLANSPAAVATPVTSMNSGHMGLPMNPLPAGMMIPMPMAHMALPPHMQMGMAPMGLLRAPHMPGKSTDTKCITFCIVTSVICFRSTRPNYLFYFWIFVSTLVGMPGGFAPYGAPLGFPMMPPRFR